MTDRDLKATLLALEPSEIAAVERFVARLLRQGWIRPGAAHWWHSALALRVESSHLRGRRHARHTEHCGGGPHAHPPGA
jgi:hypothetical protein